MTLLTDLAQFIRSQPDGCHQVVSYYLEAIQAHNDTLNAVSIPLRERALATAQLRDQELRAGHDRGPLHGIPFGIKEVMDVGGVVTTAGCPGYAQRHGIPTQDAALVQRIESAGAIPLAKTQTNDLAYGLDGLNAHYGDTHNPWDPSRISGGSSSGSAAAVCAGLMPIALGTDTGGSVRVPSAYTGIAGIRSTFGQDTRGLVHLVPIFDTVGPMARSAWDVALMQAVLTGDPLPSRRQTLAGIRLGVEADAGLSKLTPNVRTIYDASLASLQSVGSHLEAIQLPPFADGTAFQVFTVLGGVQALATHRAAVEDPNFEMDPRTRQRLERGTTFKGVDYVEALQSQAQLRSLVEKALTEVDALLLPVSPTTAPLKGVDQVTLEGSSFSIREQTLSLCCIGALSGLPIAAIPAGLLEGLPLGWQLVGKRGSDLHLLALADAIQTHLAVPFQPVIEAGSQSPWASRR